MGFLRPRSKEHNRFKGKIARKLTALMLLTIIIPLALASLWGYFWLKRYATEVLTKQLQQSEQITEKGTENWLLSKSAHLDEIASQSAFQKAMQVLLTKPQSSTGYTSARKKILDALQPLIHQGSPPIFNTILVLNPQIQVVASTKGEWNGLALHNSDLGKLITQSFPKNLTALAKVAEAKDPYGSAHYFRYNLAPLYKSESILVTIYPYNPTNSQEPSAYIVGISEEIALSDVLQPLETAIPQSNGFVITEEGVYLARDQHLHILRGMPMPSPLLQKWQKFTEGEFNAEYVSPVTGKQVIAHVRWAPKWHASIGVEIPRALFYKPIHKFGMILLQLALALLTIVAIAVIAVSSKFTRPILEIANSTRLFAEGDWRIRAPVKSNDELGLLAYSFNRMADQLSELYYSLEEQVETRSGQIKTAAEVAILATSAENLEDILERTVNLIVERFPQYYHASVFLLDESGGNAVLKASTGEVGQVMRAQGHRLAVNGNSVVGQATGRNEPQIIQDTDKADFHFKNPLLPETRAEAAVPISIGDRVLGALDVQSKTPNIFDEASIDTLRTLASLLAIAIYNIKLREQAEINLEEVNALYRSVLRLSQTDNPREFIDIAISTMQELPAYSAIVLRNEAGSYEINVIKPAKIGAPIPSVIAPAAVLKEIFPRGITTTIKDVDNPDNPPHVLIEWAKALHYKSVIALPVYLNRELQTIILLGSTEKDAFPEVRVETYELVITVAERMLERIIALRKTKHEAETSNLVLSIAREMLLLSDNVQRFRSIKNNLTDKFGDVSVVIASYNALERRIVFSYAYTPEDGEVSLPPTEIGTGPVSQVINTRKPLVLDEGEAAAFSPEAFSHKAKRWIGIPLIAHDQLLGVLIVADFKERVTLRKRHIGVLEEVAGTTALLLYQISRAETSVRRANREHLLFQMNEELRRARNIHQVMEIALQQIQEALGIQKGVIRLTPSGRNPEPEKGEGEK